jgi:hypothetical protein
MKKIAIDVLNFNNNVIKTFNYLSTDGEEANDYFIRHDIKEAASLPDAFTWQVRDLGYIN